jgi:hypothetical protein
MKVSRIGLLVSVAVALVASDIQLHAEDKSTTVGLVSKVWVPFKTTSSGEDHHLRIYNGARPCYEFQDSNIVNEDKTDKYWWEK